MVHVAQLCLEWAQNPENFDVLKLKVIVLLRFESQDHFTIYFLSDFFFFFNIQGDTLDYAIRF